MKKFVFLLLLLIFAAAGNSYAQTTSWAYSYSISPDGTKYNDTHGKYFTSNFRYMAFSQNKGFVSECDRNGIAKATTGFRYSSSEKGFNTYMRSSLNPNSQVEQLSNEFGIAGEKALYNGNYIVALSFNQKLDTMLIHMSDGTNHILKSTSESSKPKVRY